MIDIIYSKKQQIFSKVGQNEEFLQSIQGTIFVKQKQSLCYKESFNREFCFPQITLHLTQNRERKDTTLKLSARFYLNQQNNPNIINRKSKLIYI